MSIQKTEIEQLYSDSYQRLLTMARLMLKDEKEAEDVVGDLFARLAEGTFTLPSERPESYLLTAVRNNCLDRIRRLSLRERMERRLSLSEPGASTENGDLQRLKEMIDYAEMTFPRQTWRVFQLRFEEGMQYSEIAEKLGISETSVYKHLAKALERLKEKFNPTSI